MKRFELCGPLPVAGTTTVLEASAGTGKTFTLAGLVTRYVAEGTATLDEMLLITFGRSATQELRERIREALQVKAPKPHFKADAIAGQPVKVAKPWFTDGR
jgi:exodeoxyribonuclease V beta subunit